MYFFFLFFFVGILCAMLGFCLYFIVWAFSFRMENPFLFAPRQALFCGLVLMVFGACVIFSTKLAAFLAVAYL